MITLSDPNDSYLFLNDSKTPVNSTNLLLYKIKCSLHVIHIPIIVSYPYMTI